MSPGSLRRLSRRAIGAAAAGFAVAAIGALALAAAPAQGWMWGLLVGGAALLALALWLLADGIADHLRALDRVRALAVALQQPGVGAASAHDHDDEDAETAGLRAELLALATQRRRERAATERRLAAVIANLRDAVIVVTAQGQVSLANGKAQARFGADRLTVGTSVFAALVREPLIEAIGRARAGGAPVIAMLATAEGERLEASVAALADGGAVISAADGALSAELCRLDHDLALHDLPPPAPPLGAGTPLDALPATALDTETTGLAPSRDRVVSLGAVRLHGPTVYRSAMLDRLVDPQMPIPPSATAIHGIGDEMVAGAPPFAATLADFDRLSAGTAVIGHNIGFDLAVLRAECARRGLHWREPAAVLDLLQVAAALDRDETALDLEAVAKRHGLDPLGRHTALGDALLTAELWRRLLPRLRAQGIVTLGQAQALAATATRVIARQRAAGW